MKFEMNYCCECDLVGLGSGGAGCWAKGAGTTGKVIGYGIKFMDIGGNVVGGGKNIYDIAENGPNFSNVTGLISNGVSVGMHVHSFVDGMKVRYNTVTPEPTVPPGTYRPESPLPVNKDGVPIPSGNTPHTQLGTNVGRKGPYTAAREFGYDGERIRDIHFTDHGRLGHTNPHQHPALPNPTGGTPIFGPHEPFIWP